MNIKKIGLKFIGINVPYLSEPVHCNNVYFYNNNNDPGLARVQFTCNTIKLAFGIQSLKNLIF